MKLVWITAVDVFGKKVCGLETLLTAVHGRKKKLFTWKLAEMLSVFIETRDAVFVEDFHWDKLGHFMARRSPMVGWFYGSNTLAVCSLLACLRWCRWPRKAPRFLRKLTWRVVLICRIWSTLRCVPSMLWANAWGVKAASLHTVFRRSVRSQISPGPVYVMIGWGNAVVRMVTSVGMPMVKRNCKPIVLNFKNLNSLGILWAWMKWMKWRWTKLPRDLLAFSTHGEVDVSSSSTFQDVRSTYSNIWSTFEWRYLQCLPWLERSLESQILWWVGTPTPWGGSGTPWKGALSSFGSIFEQRSTHGSVRSMQGTCWGGEMGEGLVGRKLSLEGVPKMRSLRSEHSEKMGKCVQMGEEWRENTRGISAIWYATTPMNFMSFMITLELLLFYADLLIFRFLFLGFSFWYLWILTVIRNPERVVGAQVVMHKNGHITCALDSVP